MHERNEPMDSNVLLRIINSLLAAAAAAVGVFACYKYSRKLMKRTRGKVHRGACVPEAPTPQIPEEQAAAIPAAAGDDDTATLRRECWDSYVELQTVVARKDACRKCLVGDTGIATAVRQLKNILASGRNDEYMAPRINGQVCCFIANTLVASRMVDVDGTITMPPSKPALMDPEIYFRNISVPPDEQAEKYRKVAYYQRASIEAESADTRFADMLRDLLPILRQAYDIAEGNTELSPDLTVIWGREFFDKTSKIIENDGK